MPAEHPFSFDSTTTAELEQARTLVRQGHLAEAEQAYAKVAAADPDQLEAVRFLANAALSRGDPGTAVSLLSRAAANHRDEVGLLLDLAAAYQKGDRRDEARQVLRLVLHLTHGQDTTARLMLAYVCESDQRPEPALVHYFRAILDAQAHGKWLSDETTEPGLQRLVRHALEYVALNRRTMFEAAVADVRRGSTQNWARFDAALSSYLTETPKTFDDPRQRVSFLYVPNLGTQPILAASAVPGLDELALGMDAFTAGIGACAGDAPAPRSTTPFSFADLSRGDGAGPPPAEIRRIPLWSRGNPSRAATDHLQAVRPMLDALPLMRAPGYGENIVLLDVPPGAQQAAEYGRSNAICTAAIACADQPATEVVVGGETHTLAPHSALVCDPSFGIGFRNRSGKRALVMLVDVWHPALSGAERRALDALAAAVVRFDARLENPDEAAA